MNTEVEQIKEWIGANCSRSAQVQKDFSAYRLKHKIEFDTGFYIGEKRLIRIFESLGFRHKKEAGKTLFFAYIKASARKPRVGRPKTNA